MIAQRVDLVEKIGLFNSMVVLITNIRSVVIGSKGKFCLRRKIHVNLSPTFSDMMQDCNELQ